MREENNVTQQKREAPKKRTAVSFVIVFLCLGAMLMAGAYFGMGRLLDKSVFAQGTTVDGLDLTGLTLKEGLTLTKDHEDRELAKIEIPVVFNGTQQVFTAEQLGIKDDVAAITDQAFSYNKTGNVFVDYEQTLNPKSFRTTIEIDDAKLKDTVEQFIKENGEPPLDAQAKFDKSTHEFSYTSEEPGVTANADALTALLKERIGAQDYSKLGVQNERIMPEITEQELKENTELIGKCETKATNNENRDVNIQLMCKAINGLVLQPGETLSINELVGERTAEKGFKEAPAIMDGKKLVDELGGGICQVAGTLYNAALLADMEIVERVRHSWPSEYLPIGQDATLNWDDKDLKIKNTTEYPMYIAADFYDHNVSIQIFGQPSEYEIQIESNILEEIPVPKPEVIYTDELPAGQRKTTITGRKGYQVETYRNYLLDGKIVESEKISEDYFHEIKGTVLEGTDNTIK